MRGKNQLRLLAISLLVLAAILALRPLLQTEFVIQQESALRDFVHKSPWQATSAALLVYTLASMIPGANGKSFVIGWLFGIWWGTLIINLGATLAAAAIFLVSRYSLRSAIRGRYFNLADRLDKGLHREGPFLLFSLRLIPLVPYTLLNPLAGVTSLRTRTFVWVTQLGMLPSNGAYAFVGASLPSLRDVQARGVMELFSPQLAVAILLLSVFPLAARLAVMLARRVLRAREWHC